MNKKKKEITPNEVKEHYYLAFVGGIYSLWTSCPSLCYIRKNKTQGFAYGVLGNKKVGEWDEEIFAKLYKKVITKGYGVIKVNINEEGKMKFLREKVSFHSLYDNS